MHGKHDSKEMSIFIKSTFTDTCIPLLIDGNYLIEDTLWSILQNDDR